MTQTNASATAATTAAQALGVVRPIRAPGDHERALAEIERLWGAPEDTPEGDRLEVLVTLVEAYEDRHHPIPEVDPVELLRFAIEDMGRSQAELADLLGSRARASEVLARKRALTLPMIRKIADAWRLPVELLVRDYPLAV